MREEIVPLNITSDSESECEGNDEIRHGKWNSEHHPRINSHKRNVCYRFFWGIWDYRRILIITCIPFICLPLPLLSHTQEAKCGYILMVVSIYWVTEVIPMYVTALIPAFLVPMFGIMNAKDVSSAYIKDNIMLMIGALIVGSVIEYRNLHKRVALKVLLLMGTNLKFLILGFMLPTWFLSMWINNTATTVMILPIVDAVLKNLGTSRPIETENCARSSANTDDGEIIEIKISPNDPLTREEHHKGKNTKKVFNMAKVLNICVAYAATCGGVATLTGTGTNVVFLSLVTQEYGSETGLNYGTWIMYAMPISLINLIITWLWLVIYYLGFRELFNSKTNNEEHEKVNHVLRREYMKLGPMDFAEKSSLFHLCLFIVLCCSEEPYANIGWNVLFKSYGKGYIAAAQPSLFVALLVMIWPERNPFSIYNKTFILTGSGSLITWKEVEARIPWGVLLLIGGGMAMAEASNKSGLAIWIGETLSFLDNMPVPVLVYAITVGSAILTEFTSNSATASILIPIIFYLAACINVNPLLISLPCAVGCSFAFCLPVATPPNAIVFASGYLKVIDMVKTGIFLVLITTFVATVATLTYGTAIFGLNKIPPWQKPCLFNDTEYT